MGAGILHCPKLELDSPVVGKTMFFRKKNPKHPITLRTRLTMENQLRFLELVRSRNTNVAALLNEAVGFYLDHYLQESFVLQSPAESYTAADYDELDEGPRLPRFKWGS